MTLSRRTSRRDFRRRELAQVMVIVRRYWFLLTVGLALLGFWAGVGLVLSTLTR
jgi:hypothetical protein